jgi:hypothetical protein
MRPGAAVRQIRAALLLAATASGACGGAEVVSANPSRPPPGSPDAAASVKPMPPPALPPSTDAPALPPPSLGGEGTPICAEEARMAERLPLDLVLLVDRSSSMTGTKWEMSRAALTTFIADPKSAGLGVGLQFFPYSPNQDSPCGTDQDCGFPFAGPVPACVERRVCVGAPGTPPSCGRASDPPCAAGTSCAPLGRCSAEALYCTNLGGPCPGAAGMCKAVGKTCRESDFSESCNADVFRRLSVDIGLLPAFQPALVAALAATNPTGGTPMVQAVQGTFANMRGYLGAHPDHRMALVLATDGVPSPCGTAAVGDPVAAVVAQVAAARMATPSITTYGIGVFDPAEGPKGPAAVTDIAAAGGTGAAFVLSPTSDLSQKLLEALEKIRGSALPCEFTIPPPQSGSIDFGKVNLHFKGVNSEQDVLYVAKADRCDPTRGGWYYDVDPMAGTPQKVVVCDATCRLFKADPRARVVLGFGCKTRVIE